MKKQLIFCLVLIGATLAAWRIWPQDDLALQKALVGAWRADDVSNSALHRRKAGVKTEQAVFQPDGKLTYTVSADSDKSPPAGEPWGWEVVKGRLVLRYLGSGSTEERMSPLRFSLSDGRLSIHRKGYPSKDFTRISS